MTAMTEEQRQDRGLGREKLAIKRQAEKTAEAFKMFMKMFIGGRR